jgi:thiol-disulfide isomerase/thioredoxin
MMQLLLPGRSRAHARPRPPLLGATLLRALTTVLAGALLAVVPAAAQRVPADNVLRDFQRISDYVLVFNGKQVPAEIYQSQRAAAILIISSSIPSPVLLSPGSGSASTVNLMKVEKKPDGTIDLLADAQLAPQGAIELTDEEIHFKVDGHSAALATAPPLLGLRRADEVTAHNPEYVPRAAAFTPNPQALARLKREARPVSVRVFYGSWCPHCRELVPHVVKLEQALKGGKIRFEYWGLPRNFGTDLPAKQNNIRAVPTGIVYVNGKEIGRITGNAWNAMETNLVTLLSGKPIPEG